MSRRIAGRVPLLSHPPLSPEDDRSVSPAETLSGSYPVLIRRKSAKGHAQFFKISRRKIINDDLRMVVV